MSATDSDSADSLGWMTSSIPRSRACVSPKTIKPEPRLTARQTKAVKVKFTTILVLLCFNPNLQSVDSASVLSLLDLGSG